MKESNLDETLDHLTRVLWALVENAGGTVTIKHAPPVTGQFYVSWTEDGSITVSIAERAPASKQ
jgi:hypothetical protein